MLKKLSLFVIPLILATCSKDNPVSLNMVEKYHADIEDIRVQVQSWRQLQFLSPIGVGAITREQFGGKYTYYPYANNLMITLKQLGYLPDTLMDLEKILIDYYTGFPIAYYTQGSDSITLVEDELSRNQLRAYIAHEFTHALQDQHFNIGTGVFIPSRMKSRYNSDFYVARKCMVEGDAEIQELRFGYNITSPSTIVDTFANRRQRFLKNLKQYQFPGYLRIQGLFPYYTGALKVAELFRDGGWDAVNSLFHANRFMSTAEVITGEKFEAANFEVSEILKEWIDNSVKIQYADDDNFGAVMLMALLNNYVDEAHCMKAFGWRGDRLIYMRSNDEQWGKMVWCFAFKEKADAEYIVNALDQMLRARKLNGNSASETRVHDSLYTYQTGTVKTSLILSGTSLFWIENVDNAQTIASTILNSGLAKKSVTDDKIEVDQEMINVKKAFLGMMLDGR